MLHVLAFNDLRQECAPGGMAPILHYRMAHLLGGIIVRTGFGFEQLGFECMEHLKNRFTQQGHNDE
jgi:hypothetical protein